jgi:flagellar M-ring protein FliF
MEILNTFSSRFWQLADRFRSMPQATRIAAAVLLGVAAVGTVYLLAEPFSNDQVYLFDGASVLPKDRPAMEAAFARKQLNAYAFSGNRVRVPRKQLSDYVNALAEAGALPQGVGRNPGQSIAPGGMFPTPGDQRLREHYVKEDQLARILSSWDFIADAAVIIDAASRGGFRRETIVTASVSVTPLGSQRLDGGQVASIRQFICGAVAGLKPENVQISDGTGSVDGNEYVALTKIYEREWKSKILDALAYIPRVVVTTNVVLDRQRMSRSKVLRVGPPSRHTNLANAPQSLSSEDVPAEGDEPPLAHAAAVPATETTETETTGYTPTRVSVSIGVPSSYFEKAWRDRNGGGSAPESTPDRAALERIRQEETAKISTQVATLLPPAEGVADATDLVNVSTFSDLPPERVPEPGFDRGIATWLENHWLTLGAVALTALGLMTLRSTMRSRPLVADVVGAPGAFSMETPDEQPDVATVGQRQGERSLRDELRKVVRDDPAAAADVLKTWIGQAS